MYIDLSKLDLKTSILVLFISLLNPFFNLDKIILKGFYFFTSNYAGLYAGKIILSIVVLWYFISYCLILDFLATKITKRNSEFVYILSAFAIIIGIFSLFSLIIDGFIFLLGFLGLLSLKSLTMFSFIGYAVIFLIILLLLKAVKDIYETDFITAFLIILLSVIFVSMAYGTGFIIRMIHWWFMS